MDPDTMGMLNDWKKVKAEEMLGLGCKVLKPEQLVFSNLKSQFIKYQRVSQMIV